MGRAVLLSIQPKWCELIASGKKTVEVRKTAPKLKTPFKVYIYCTHGDNLNCLRTSYFSNATKFWVDNKAFGVNVTRVNGKVIGEFVCTSVTEFSVPYPAYFDSMGYCVSRLLVDAQVTKSAAHHYLKQKNGYGWRITDLIIYDKLHTMLVKADAGKLEFEPSCPLDLLRRQAKAMGQYLYSLEVRAMIEDVEL